MTTNQTWQPMETEQRLNDLARVRAQFQLGDTFTMNGRYKRRSFMQWLRKKPKQLQIYVVVDSCPAYSLYEPIEKDEKK